MTLPRSYPVPIPCLLLAATLLVVSCARQSADVPTDTATDHRVGELEAGPIADDRGLRRRVAGTYELVSIRGFTLAEYARRVRGSQQLISQQLKLAPNGSWISTRTIRTAVSGAQASQTTVDSGTYEWSRSDGPQLFARGFRAPFSVRDDGQIEGCGMPQRVAGTLPCSLHLFRRIASSR